MASRVGTKANETGEGKGKPDGQEKIKGSVRRKTKRFVSPASECERQGKRKRLKGKRETKHAETPKTSDKPRFRNRLRSGGRTWSPRDPS